MRICKYVCRGMLSALWISYKRLQRFGTNELMMTMPGGGCSWHVWGHLHTNSLSLNSPWCQSHNINPPSMLSTNTLHAHQQRRRHSCNHHQLSSTELHRGNSRFKASLWFLFKLNSLCVSVTDSGYLTLFRCFAQGVCSLSWLFACLWRRYLLLCCQADSETKG